MPLWRRIAASLVLPLQDPRADRLRVTDAGVPRRGRGDIRCCAAPIRCPGAWLRHHVTWAIASNALVKGSISFKSVAARRRCHVSGGRRIGGSALGNRNKRKIRCIVAVAAGAKRNQRPGSAIPQIIDFPQWQLSCSVRH